MTQNSKRVLSIDILRGLIMALMALDHTRDYFHITAATEDPTNLATTTPILFFTRFITHYCAPTFVFLSGVSIYLQSLRKSGAQLSLFLLTRGLWLVFMELTLVNFGWSFNIYFNFLFLQVIWAIGCSMVILSLAIRFPYWVVVSAGSAITLLHNLTDIYIPENEGLKVAANFLVMTDFSMYEVLGIRIMSAYAIVPWTGIMLLGFGAGKWFDTTRFNHLKRRSYLVYSGLSLITLFVILRLINDYGDPKPWVCMKTNTYTLLSYLNVTKYPPSLMYTCITLGPALLVLAVLETQPFSWFLRAMNTLGRVPFFYYLLHIYVIHILCVGLYFTEGFAWGQLDTLPQMFAFRPSENFGFQLGYVYLVWIGVVTICYFPCRWYDRYKSTHKKWWLGYL
ncbi:MAG: DUF1624 domain-containing protein [Bacteroidia bacterium]